MPSGQRKRDRARGPACSRPTSRRVARRRERPGGNGLITVDDPVHIAKQLKRSGPLNVADIDVLAEALRTALPPAS
jgi:hypothetical protein